jgi:TolB-like protein/DNA-binding winged helix-turn-helix (wHTH) protein
LPRFSRESAQLFSRGFYGTNSVLESIWEDGNREHEMNQGRFSVGKWTVDPDLGRIFNVDQEVRLEPKAMDVLVYLAHRAGEAVTRQELEQNVWAGTIVSYEALSVIINKLRKALQDDSRKSRYIETLSKKGYRLIAPVSWQTHSDAAVPADAGTGRPTTAGLWRYAGPAAQILSLLLLALVGYSTYHLGSDTGSGIPENAARTEMSIAVLPFNNISGDRGQEYIANGVTEDVITDLSRLSRLLVISRSSVLGYAGMRVSAQQVGEDLGVRYVLTGSVRKSGDRIRISAQLTDAGNNVQIWADRFDRKSGELIAVQDEIIQKIVTALVIRLSDEEQVALRRRYTDSLEAHDFYSRGRALYGSITKEGNTLARKMFNRAIELDPRFARAYGALALTHVDDYRRKWGGDPEESVERALATARKAVAIDEDEAVAHWVLGYVYLYGKKDAAQAIRSAEQALALYPSYADAYALVASANSFLGRSDDAIRLNRYAMRLNPTASVVYYANLGRDYYFKDQLPEATRHLKEAISRNYNYLNAHLYLAATLARTGEIEEAKWEMDDLRALDPGFSLTYWADTQPYTSEDRLDRLVADLRKAGAPE